MVANTHRTPSGKNAAGRKAATGITPRQYASAWRLDRFKAMIKDGRDIATALNEAGFGSSSRLYQSLRAPMGMSPGVSKKGAGA